LSEYKSSDPQRGVGFLPRRALNIPECEIARAFKVAGSTIEPIAFIVPRKADSFQSDIFPPAPSLEPSLTAAEFFAGKSAPAKLIELNTGAIKSSPVEFNAVQPLWSPDFTTATSIARETSVPGDDRIQYQALKTTSLTPNIAISPVMPASSSKAVASIHESSMAQTSPGGNNDADLQAENEQMKAELRDAKAKIRSLELQLETMRANAQRAAKALQLE